MGHGKKLCVKNSRAWPVKGNGICQGGPRCIGVAGTGGNFRVPANPEYTTVGGDVRVLGVSQGSSAKDNAHDNLPPEAGVSSQSEG